MVPARAIASGLHVEPVVDTVDDDLCLALRLHIAAHDAKGHYHGTPSFDAKPGMIV